MLCPQKDNKKWLLSDKTLTKMIMDEDKTLQNEDTLEDNEDEYEADSTGEGDGSEEEERTYTQSELEAILKEDRKKHDKNWRERLKKASGEEDSQEGSHKASQEANSKEVTSDVILARLEARGILDSEIQEYLIGEGKRLMKNPVELLSDDYYQKKVEEKKQKKEQEAATPPPSRRTGKNDSGRDLGYWLKQAEKGQLPKDNEMRRKVLAQLSGR